MEGTKGYTTSSATSGYTFVGGEYISLAVTGKGVTSRPTTEIMKQYTVASGSSGSNALTYAKDADGSTTTYAFDWLGTGETISLRAWSDGKTTTPAAAVDPDGQLFTIETTQAGSVRELLYSPAADYSYATASGAINIPLYHQLARVVVNIRDDATGTPTLAAVTLGSATDKVPVSGTFTKPTSGNNFGSWAVASEATQSTHWGVITPKAETAATGYDYTYSAVAIPGGPTEYAAGGKLINITIGSETFSYEVPAGGITLAAGKQYNYNITVKNQTINVETVITDWNDVADAHTSYIPPAERRYFTVDASGTQVDFAPGNLQAKIASGPTNTYNYTASEWKFADNQWEYLYNPLDADAVTNKEWVDHFGWVGTTASWDTYGLCTSTAEGNSTYYGTDGDGDALKTDWGSIPGVIAAVGTGWRTLTNDEWGYVFDTRETGTVVGTTNHARYTEATIRTDVSGGVNGIILFPDGVTFAASEFATLGTLNAASDWTTKCTAAQWTALNAKGCVFLPAAGRRGGAGVDGGGSNGYYWSASPLGAGRARNVYFYSGNVYPQSKSSPRRNGFSVRLVREHYEYQAPKTTVATATTADLAVGDIVCSDGTIYDPAAARYVRNAHKTPIGIIAFVNDGSSIGDAATEKGLGRYPVKSQGRALVFCLRNASTPIAWRTTNTPFGSSYTSTDASFTTATFYPGWQRTHDMNSTEFPAAYSAYNYSGLPAPAGTTGWFLPSSGQWKKIISNFTPFQSISQGGAWSVNTNAAYTSQYLAGLMDAWLAPAGAYDTVRLFDGTTDYYYWTSSESNADCASRIDMPSDTTLGFDMLHMGRTYTAYVRPVLAF